MSGRRVTVDHSMIVTLMVTPRLCGQLGRVYILSAMCQPRFSINSAVNDGEVAVYDESCSSILASTFSSGRAGARSSAGVATTDLYGNCTMKHSGK